MTAEIRAATLADVASIVAIERGSFADPWSATAFAGMLSGPRTRMQVVTDSGSVVGYAVLLLAPPDADLADLAIAPDARGRGLGRALLDAVIAAARDAGVSRIFLEVRESNAPAIALYERAGFAECGKRSRYYRDPVEDALVYRMNVEPE